MSQARIIDGSAIAAGLRQRIGVVAAHLHDEAAITPGLATVLVGDNAASQVYIRAKARAFAGSGLAAFDIRLPADISQADLVAEVAKLNGEDGVDGILVQLPIPQHIDPDKVINAVDPSKDVDGFHPANIGRLWSGGAGFVP